MSSSQCSVPTLHPAACALGMLLALVPAVPTAEADSAPACVLTFGSQGTGDGQFNSVVRDIAVGPDGNVYVIDQTNRVQRFDSDGVFLSKWNVPGLPLGLTVDQTGNVYVAVYSILDYGAYQYSGIGGFIRRFGLGLPAFIPEDIAVDAGGFVYAASLDSMVYKFAGDGTHLLTWRCQVGLPLFIACTTDGETYVTGDIHLVERFSSAGGSICSWQTRAVGSPLPAQGWGVATDWAGRVHVGVLTGVRVYVADGCGPEYWSWGATGSACKQFQGASGVAVSTGSTLGRVYVGDQAQVKVFDFLTSAGTRSWGALKARYR